MRRNSLISIIIPTYNRAHLLFDTLDSILEQTYTNWECLIVDDGSTIETIQVIKNYVNKDNRFKFFKRKETSLKGANTCRNIGLEKSIGDYIIFFDSDDIMDKTCLEVRFSCFNKNINKDMLIFSMGLFKDKSFIELDLRREVINLNIEDTIIKFIFSNKIPWNVSRPIFKSEFIKNKIKFNEKIQNFQDDEFNLRVLKFLKPKYLSIDITDSFYRNDVISINKYNNLKGKQNIIDSLYEFYNTVFLVLNKNQIKKFRKKLICKFFKQILGYVNPETKTSELFKTFLLFKKKLNLTLIEKTFFYFIIILNKYYYNRKGYYFLSGKFKIYLCK